VKTSYYPARSASREAGAFALGGAVAALIWKLYFADSKVAK
jgi:hypothetical protein